MKKLVIIDFYNFLYRAYFGIRPLHSKNGEQVNALYGMGTMIAGLLRDHKPTHLVVVEEGGQSWRKAEYSEYKATRSKMPPELASQISMVKTMIAHLNIPMLSVSGYEADDVIASLALQSDCDEVLIASSDKDLCQLVNDKIKIIDTMKQKTYDSAGVKEKFGVEPKLIVDYLSLVGDTSDNVPGAMGIGEKTALKLLEQFGSLDNLLQSVEQVSGKNKDKIIASKDNIILSKKLVTLNTTLILEIPPNYKGPNLGPLKEFFLGYNMNSLVNRFDSYSPSV